MHPSHSDPQLILRGLNAALPSTDERHCDRNHIRSHRNREKRIVESLIENMWKAQYQKDLLQSLKQNALIKYIIDCFFKYETDI